MPVCSSFFFLLHTFTLSSKNFILIEKRKGSKSISFLNICNFILNLSFVCNPPCESCPFEFMCLFKKTKQNNNLENSLGKREKKKPICLKSIEGPHIKLAQLQEAFLSYKITSCFIECDSIYFTQKVKIILNLICLLRAMKYLTSLCFLILSLRCS